MHHVMYIVLDLRIFGSKRMVIDFLNHVTWGLSYIKDRFLTKKHCFAILFFFKKKRQFCFAILRDLEQKYHVQWCNYIYILVGQYMFIFITG